MTPPQEPLLKADASEEGPQQRTLPAQAQRLLELASKATPGEHSRSDNQDYAEINRPNAMQAMCATDADAEFLRACDPATITKLCDFILSPQSGAVTQAGGAERECTASKDEIGGLVGLLREYDWKWFGKQLRIDDYECAATAALIALGHTKVQAEPRAYKLRSQADDED